MMLHLKIFSAGLALAIVIGVGLLISACSGNTLAGSSAAAPEAKLLRGAVWVADEYGNSITVIDAATNKVITTLTGIEGPHNLQVAPDGKSVWAVSGHESLAVMIDTATYTLHGTVPTGAGPYHSEPRWQDCLYDQWQ